ncbi:MAG: hypothetical protein KAR42_16840 [candidate division Zixibacteria bacterium]|nr:hypothetical protein [candidate division Zixibacteria bacterium]
MIIEAWLELIDPEISAHFRDDETEMAIKLEDDLDIQCQLEEPISISANITEKYELEG